MSLYSQLPSLVLGFHGCDKAVAESVFAGQASLNLSRNEYDWLGEGIYFWESSPTRALEYAMHLQSQSRAGGPKIAKPAVIGAVIGAVIDPGHCSNLLDTKSLNLVADGYRRLKDVAAKAGSTLPANRAPATQSALLLRDLDCAVINYLHRLREEEGLKPFDTVRSAFMEGEPLYPTAGFYSKNHIQLCVRNENCIKGYFRPRLDPDSVQDL
jgi:hypothetical protein